MACLARILSGKTPQAITHNWLTLPPRNLALNPRTQCPTSAQPAVEPPFPRQGPAVALAPLLFFPCPSTLATAPPLFSPRPSPHVHTSKRRLWCADGKSLFFYFNYCSISHAAHSLGIYHIWPTSSNTMVFFCSSGDSISYAQLFLPPPLDRSSSCQTLLTSSFLPFYFIPIFPPPITPFPYLCSSSSTRHYKNR